MKPKSTIAERILEALAKKSPLSIPQLARAAGTTTATIYTLMGKLKRDKKVRTIEGKRGFYELARPPAAPPPSAKAPTAPARQTPHANGVQVLGPVEKGIPLPPVRRADSIIQERLRELREVGDSFFTTFRGSTVAAHARKLKISITRRPDVQKGVKGFRIWRTK